MYEVNLSMSHATKYTNTSITNQLLYTDLSHADHLVDEIILDGLSEICIEKQRINGKPYESYSID